MIRPQRLGKDTLPENELKEDKKSCHKFGPCGVGQKAIYLNSFYIDRQYYVPMKSVKRVFKRIAMSKGGFTGREYLQHCHTLWSNLMMADKSSVISSMKKMWTEFLHT